MAYSDPEVQRLYVQAHYRANKADYKRRSLAARKKREDHACAAKKKPCLDCDVEYPPRVMQFHHRPDEEKVDDIWNIVRNRGMAVLIVEIAKCDVLCANCHAMRHNELPLEGEPWRWAGGWT